MTYDKYEAALEFNRIYDILKAHSNIDGLLRGELCVDEWEHDKANDVPENIWVDHGATRIVIGDSNSCKYVFKINYDINDPIDYNKNEMFIYNRAVEEGVEDWFAWIAKIGTIHIDDRELEVCAQAWCDVDFDKIAEQSFYCQFSAECAAEGYDINHLTEEESEEIYDKIDEDYVGSGAGMRDYVYSNYPYNKVRALFNFLDKYGVNDTHAGNWGYLNDELVLTDYAGYRCNLVV